MLDRCGPMTRLLPALMFCLTAACAAEESKLPGDAPEIGGGGGGAEEPKESVVCEAPAERFVASLQGPYLDCASLAGPSGPGRSSGAGFSAVVLASASPEEGTLVLTLDNGSTLTASAPGLRALPPAGTLIYVYAAITEDANHPDGCRKELLVQDLSDVPNPISSDSSIWFGGNLDYILSMLNLRARSDDADDPDDEKIFHLSIVPEPGCRADAHGCGVPGALELTAPGREPVLVGLGETKPFSLREGHPLAGDYEVRNLSSATTPAWMDLERDAEGCNPAPELWIQRK